MQFCFLEDSTRPVFTAEQHAASSHTRGGSAKLPKRAAAFCLGRGLPVLRERFESRIILDELPGFISHSPVLYVPENDQVCFLDGGRGAPQGASTVDTLHALGVEEVLIVGLCGAFGEDINVCDVVIPRKILSEEGASRHYFSQVDWVEPTPIWPFEDLEEYCYNQGFTVKPGDTVTTDAVYRQTFFKEAMWRERGCVGVDMEASAMVSVCNYYGMRSQVVLMASDKHPMTEDSPPWDWGNVDFRSNRDNCLEALIRLLLKDQKRFIQDF